MGPKETHDYRVKTRAWGINLIEACGPLARVVSELFSFVRHMLLPYGMLLMERISP